MISVIVPVYKVEAYLEKCVDSICRQTYKDLEIILVDDGSPDRCPQICDEYATKDNRIKVIHKDNGGLSSARNAGLDIARGEFISFVDSDDTIHSQMMEVLLSLIERKDIAICGHQEVKEPHTSQKNETLRKNEPLRDKDLWIEIFCKLNNAAWNKLYRKRLIGQLRFPIELLHGEDLIFNLNYLCQCKSGAINRTPLYNYIKREGSITKSKFSNKRLLEIASKDAAYEIVKKNKSEYLPIAELFAFRARMNVLRAIYHEHLEEQYQAEILNILSYTKEHYWRVKKLMKFKERSEYVLLRYFKPIYSKII